MMEAGDVGRPDGIDRLSHRDLIKVATRLSSPKSRQFIASNRSQKDPSRRERDDRRRFGLIWSGAVNDIFAPDHTVSYGTDLCLGHLPGNELPGYDRSVPTGKSRSTALTFPT
jgi:hypothetical protein